MSGETILVRGPSTKVALIGALLARRWLGPGTGSGAGAGAGSGAGSRRTLVLAPTNAGEPADRHIVARPDHMRFHAEIGLPLEALIKSGTAQPVLAPRFSSASGPISVPFAPVAAPHEGVEFHHFWLRHRAIAGDEASDLFDLSPAIALDHSVGAGAPRWDAVLKGGLAFGLRLERGRYAGALLQLAQRAGALVDAGKAGDHAPDEHGDLAGDLVIECGPERSGGGAQAEAGAWSNGRLTLPCTLPCTSTLPGAEWQVCVNAARRFVGLSAPLANSANEQREYTRLAQQEAQRIADMDALLQESDPLASHTFASTHPALARKLALFAACGRIPTEDFEVFTPLEWLAAMWGRGVRPRRYDRMANRMPQQQLIEWLASLKRQRDALTRARETV